MKCNNNDNYIDKAKLKWACRRGMLELDVLLGNFLTSSYDQLAPEDQARFVQLLDCADPELFAWLLGHATPEDPDLLIIVKIIRQHARA